jgi:hypothetical protein
MSAPSTKKAPDDAGAFSCLTEGWAYAIAFSRFSTIASKNCSVVIQA